MGEGAKERERNKEREKQRETKRERDQERQRPTDRRAVKAGCRVAKAKKKIYSDCI